METKNQACQRYGRAEIWPYLRMNFYRNEFSGVPTMNSIPWNTSTGLLDNGKKIMAFVS
jgi:hypothetical protein